MAEEKVSKNWKYGAIILAALLLLETAGIIFLFKVGADMMAGEDKCQSVTCSDPSAVSYSYSNGICKCFDRYHNQIKAEVTGG